MRAGLDLAACAVGDDLRRRQAIGATHSQSIAIADGRNRSPQLAASSQIADQDSPFSV